MEDIYLLMMIVLVVLAIVDLFVGVSNDAVNFLNSAIGSKAIPLRGILIIASFGVFIGASFSSGMMEIARSGIFNPAHFNFDEVMIIFITVMITDVLLLDFFNTIGLPTSTTVSIVFELLGASVVLGLIKIANSETAQLASIIDYINGEKVLFIISGILLSVVIAFTTGLIVQFFSRLIFTFQVERKMKYFGALFGASALTSISYFILIKGLSGTPFHSYFQNILEGNLFLVLLLTFIAWTIIGHIVQTVFKKNFLVVVIGAGTFGLALAFAGNDLVNFIGVPIAAYHSYVAWTGSGLSPTELNMQVLADEVPAEPFILFIAGAIMVFTLWFSKKSRTVSETEINLARQGEGHEQFMPNFLSRFLVKTSTQFGNFFGKIIPQTTLQKIDARFKKPEDHLPRHEAADLPAFDLIRASINLMTAGILIAIATSMKLPLSTTYVTFMVAMGTSFADRAWDRESAVYRVAGVLKVIGGWFFTAFIGFVTAGTIAYLIFVGREVAIAVLLLLAVLLLARNYISFKKKSKTIIDETGLKKTESKTVQGIIQESADNIAKVVHRSNKIYSNMLRGLATQDTGKLKKSKKGVKKLNKEVDDLRYSIFYFIKELDEKSVRGSNFYIIILGYLQDVTNSLSYIAKASYKHVNNNHKALRFNQIKDLKEINRALEELFDDIEEVFKNREIEKIRDILDRKEEFFALVTEKIDSQVSRTRTEESSPKNTALYFSILLESKDLITAVMNLLEEYYVSYKKE